MIAMFFGRNLAKNVALMKKKSETTFFKSETVFPGFFQKLLVTDNFLLVTNNEFIIGQL